MTEPERGESAGRFVAAMAVLLAAVAALSWRQLSRQSRPAALDPSGFDVTAVDQPAPAQEGSPAAAAPSSGLGLIVRSPRLDADRPPAQAAPAGFNEIARRSGGKVSAFTIRFRERHPEMREYSRQWLSYPDLRKLDEDYRRDRDFVKFVRGMTVSPNFGPLVRKIAADPKARGLAMEFVAGVVKEAPPELAAAAGELVNGEKAVLELVSGMATALGMPPEILSGLTGSANGGGSAKKGPSGPR